MDDLTVRPATSSDWDTIAALFGANGACGGCWCMHPRCGESGPRWRALKGAPNRERFRALVTRDAVHGVLAFDARTPVGWCSFGPRTDFPRLARARVLKRESPNAPWSIVCFYIPAKRRGQGIAGKLLAGAVARMAELGVREIEGYPVVVEDGQRAPGAFAWTGVPALFAAAGFAPERKPGVRRSVWVRAL